MTVKELIDALTDVPDDARVYVWNEGERLAILEIDLSFVFSDGFVDLNVR